MDNNDIDRTGLKIWKCELLLAKRLIQNEKNAIESKNSFLEIGAGFSGLALQFLMKFLEKISKLKERHFYFTDAN